MKHIKKIYSVTFSCRANGTPILNVNFVNRVCLSVPHAILFLFCFVLFILCATLWTFSYTRNVYFVAWNFVTTLRSLESFSFCMHNDVQLQFCFFSSFLYQMTIISTFKLHCIDGFFMCIFVTLFSDAFRCRGLWNWMQAPLQWRQKWRHATFTMALIFSWISLIDVSILFSYKVQKLSNTHASKISKIKCYVSILNLYSWITELLLL